MSGRGGEGSGFRTGDGGGGETRVGGETELLIIIRDEQPVGSSARGDIGDIGDIGDVEPFEDVSHSDVGSFNDGVSQASSSTLIALKAASWPVARRSYSSAMSRMSNMAGMPEKNRTVQKSEASTMAVHTTREMFRPFTGEAIVDHIGDELVEIGNPTQTLKALSLTSQTHSRCVVSLGPGEKKTIRMAVYPKNNNPSNQRDDDRNCYENMLSRNGARVDFGYGDDIVPLPGDMCELFLSIFEGRLWSYGLCEIDKVELVKDPKLAYRTILHLKKNPKKKKKEVEDEAHTSQAKRLRPVDPTKAPPMPSLESCIVCGPLIANNSFMCAHCVDAARRAS